MRNLLLITLMLALSGCSYIEHWWKDEPEPQPAPKVVNQFNPLTDKEKNYIIARHYIEVNSDKRWHAFQVLMNLAVNGFEPARVYYLSIRDTLPVLPGQSQSSFGAYANALTRITPLMEEATGDKCDKIILLNTLATETPAHEQWIFNYCGEEVTVPVRLELNGDTGNTDALPE